MKPILGLVLSAVLLLGACQPRAPQLTPQEQQTVQTLTQHMTPRCVGRYLIDLPDNMVPGAVSLAIIEAVTIRIRPLGQQAFEALLSQREAELRAEHIVGESNQPVLRYVIALPDGTGQIFDRSQNGESNGMRTLELRAWHQGFSVTMSIDARDVSYPEYKNDAQLQAMGTNVPQQQAHLLDVYKRLTVRGDTEIPAGPGVCIPYGFIRGHATDEEQVNVSYKFAGMPDVQLTLGSFSNLREKNTLLDRGAAFHQAIEAAEGHTIRKGSRVSHGVKFDEWLVSLRTQDGVKGDYFTAEANSKTGSAKTPLLVLDLFNGQREAPDDDTVLPPLARASLTEAEAVALWEKITDTLKPRPGAF